jgi:cytoskeletal protein CcmA (bactofilin family)
MYRPEPVSFRALLAVLCCVALLCCAGVALAQAGAEEEEESGESSIVAAPILMLVFLILLLAPFVPAVVEVYHPLDRYPLPVNMAYSKDPRYLGQSAWNLVTEALKEVPDGEGRHTVQMSKEETVLVSLTRTFPQRTSLDDMLYVKGDLTLEREVTCEKEVFVTGGARVDSSSRLRSLACKGDVVLSPRCELVRWMDVDGSIDVGEHCVLGILVAAGSSLKLGQAAQFRRLLGSPIATYDTSGEEVQTAAPTRKAPTPSKRIKTIEDALDWHRDSLEIEARKVAEGPLVVKGDLTLGESAVLRGSAKVYGRTEIGPGATVHGDLFCEGPIKIAEGAVITGNVFSQDTIAIRRGAAVGQRGRPKSVIAKKSIRIAAGVRVHGYVLTDGEGVVV